MNGINCRHPRAATVILLIVFVFSTLSGCASENKTSDTPFLWEIQYGDATLYLFGSIHYATEDLYPLSDVIMDAYKNSDYLMLELNPTSSAAISAPDITFRDGTKLYDVIGREAFDQYVAVLQEAHPNLQAEDVEDKTPFGAFKALTDSSLKKAGHYYSYGIEYYFIKLANKEGKPILGAETTESYLEALEPCYDLLPAMLTEMMAADYSISSAAAGLEAGYLAWRRGDLSYFENAVQSDAASDLGQQYSELVITDRNVTMIASAEACLKDGDNVFMAVGLAHLVGEDGVVAQLRDRGYDVVLLSGTEA